MTTTPDFFKRLTGLRCHRPAEDGYIAKMPEINGTIMSEPFDANKGGAPA